MMGVNGYQYINDSLGCMICDDSCTSSTCNDGPIILPWTQDYDDGINCQNTNQDLCTGGDNAGDVWDLWDVSLRDFVILDRYGVEFARINSLKVLEDCSQSHGAFWKGQRVGTFGDIAVFSTMHRKTSITGSTEMYL